MKRIIKTVLLFFDKFNEFNIPRAAAALAYFFTLTFFPLVMCLCYFLDFNGEAIVKAEAYLSTVLASGTVKTVVSFMNYVADNKSPTMAVAAFIVLITSAASAVRSIQCTIGDIQGKMRFNQISNFILSFFISLLFFVAFYICTLVLISGRSVINAINSFLPKIDISNSWYLVRYIILMTIIPLMLYTVYWMCRDKDNKYSLKPGVIVSTIGTVAVCTLFTLFIGASMQYPLVYGSMASIILLMMWIYFFGISMYSGALINVMVRDRKKNEASVVDKSES